MATYTAPTTRTTGALISASIWNTDIVENLKYFKDAPVFDGDVSVGNDLLLPSTGAVINFASGDVTITHSTNTLTFAGAASGYIFNDGNVGIGVTPSAWQSTRRVLQIGGSGSIWTDTSGMGFFFMLNNGYFDGTNYKYLHTDEATYYAQTTGGDHSFATAPSGTAGNNITFTDRFRVLNGGNIAIGATARLYFDGVAGTGGTYIHQNTTNQIQFVGGNTTLATMTSNAVVGNGAIGVGFASTNGGTSTGTAIVRNADTYFYLTSSSRRFKENIAPAVVTDAQLDAFIATTPSWWDYTGQKNGALGFIAEDLAALPLDRYGFNPLVNYDGDGQIESNRDYALIAMHHLVIQRLERKIAALEARIH
jgi:hypothetical protein